VRLYVTIDGKPAIVVGFGPSEAGPVAIIITCENTLESAPLGSCALPKVSKRLRRKIATYIKFETKAAQSDLGGPH
jgi:hypothetical protein